MGGTLDYSTTAGSNTTVGGVNIAEGMQAGLMNNALRAAMADSKKWQLDWSGIVTAGTSNAYTITSNQGIAAYSDGLRFTFRADRNNTGAATLNVDTRGAKALRKVTGGALAAVAADDIVAEAVYDVVYDLSSDVFVIVGFASPTISAFGLTLLDDADAAAARTTLGLVIGTDVQAKGDDLTAIEALGGTGIAVRTAANTWAQRTITSTGGTVTITNPGGVAGNINLEAAANWTFLSAVTTTSGTTADTTGIPSTAREVLIVLKGVSVSGTDDLLVRLGTASGFEATGYDSDGSYGGITILGTTGFAARLAGASRSHRGFMNLVLTGSNQWCEAHSTGYSNGGGFKTLADTLTQIRLLPNGTDTFDGGSYQVGYR